jgi:hypothetical protein
MFICLPVRGSTVHDYSLGTKKFISDINNTSFLRNYVDFLLFSFLYFLSCPSGLSFILSVSFNNIYMSFFRVIPVSRQQSSGMLIRRIILRITVLFHPFNIIIN